LTGTPSAVRLKYSCRNLQDLNRYANLQNNQVNRLIQQAATGSREALDEVWPELYESIREIASRQMARESNGGVLQTTAIVHEAYFRLREQDRSNWHSRTQFLSTASTMMRRILVDAARRRNAEKRDGDRVCESEISVLDQRVAVLEIHEAIKRLQEIAPDPAQVLEMSIFGGMTLPQIAEALEVSPSTVDRRLRFARAWLRRQLLEESS
jgi:RNA polymerase sigma factor (TIGR02999 family)